MRLFTLFFMVFSLLIQSQAWALYDAEVLDTTASLAQEAADCAALGKDCRNSTLSKTFRTSYELAAAACRTEQQSLKCQSLAAKEPELQKKIRNCSAQALCEETHKQLGTILKGCFWNAPGAWGTDTWNLIKQGAQSLPAAASKQITESRQCLRDEACSSKVLNAAASYSTPFQLLFRTFIPKPSEVEKTKDSVTHIYEGAKQWVQQKGIELQCFDRQSQSELICYGALQVFAPGAALKAGAQIPKIVKLLKLGQLEKTELNALESLEKTKKRSIANVTSPRSEVIEKYLRTEATSTEQNLRWIKLAENTKPDGKTKFFEVENAMMKTLNDTSQDKNLVTAITNKQKEILKSKIDSFAALHPELEILPYSDFKAMRFALRPKPPATALPGSTESELSRIFKESNAEFADFMKSNNLVLANNAPAEWFRAGFGDTADQATLASRYSRNISGPNQLRSFTDSDLHENLQTSLKATEIFRKEIQTDLAQSNLMENVPGTDKMLLKKEVFEAYRKTSSPTELQETLQKTMGTKISESQARKIRDYSELVDEFSPGIHVAKREVASLADSANGGFSIDFSGLGAYNLKATSTALIRAEKVEDAVIQTRLSEKSVTQAFQDRKETVRSSIQKILEKHGIDSEVAVSGDDLVVKPSAPIPLAVRTEIAQELPKNIDASAIRASHIPDSIKVADDRMIVATHGETIEKLTRKNLQGQLPKEKLDQVLLMVDMNSQASGQGSAQLIMGTGRVELNDLESQKVKRAFQKAVQDMNQKLRQDKLPGNYQTAS